MLAEIPRSEYMDAPVCANPTSESERSLFFKLLRSKNPAHKSKLKHQKQILKFNAVLWGRLSFPSDNLVGFFLSYKDAKGSYAVLVEEAKATESIMLTNKVEFEVYGEIEYLRACFSGLQKNQRILVDEIFVQRIAEVKEEQHANVS